VERLASQGCRFTNFYVPQAVCSASRSALMSGCYPGRTQVFGAHAPRARGLDPKFATMGEVLKGAGYRTAFALHQLDDLKRRLPEILTAEGPLLVELHTGLAEKTPMTFRDRTPLHQQIHDARVKLLRPRASAASSA